MNLTRVLAFGQSEQQQKKGITNTPIGISSIDKTFVQSKLVTTTNNNKGTQQDIKQQKKQLRDLDTVLREFSQ